jgi:hypothetical protein
MVLVKKYQLVGEIGYEKVLEVSEDVMAKERSLDR